MEGGCVLLSVFVCYIKIPTDEQMDMWGRKDWGRKLGIYGKQNGREDNFT